MGFALGFWCFDSSHVSVLPLQALLGATISRVHLVLLREGDRHVAYDVASMHGTYAGGQRIKRYLLPDRGAEIVLSQKEATLRWYPPRA